MHASETISLVYPEPLNPQDQKVSAMNSDLLNPCPINCLNSAQTSKQTLFFLCHQLLDLGEDNRKERVG